MRTLKTYLYSTLLIVFSFVSCSEEKKVSKVDFNEHIRPIITTKCMSCHGGVKKLGGFSILTRKEALAESESGETPIIPGEPENSSLLKLIKENDPELRMPQEGPPLSKEEITLIEKWIEEGAEWQDHWSFVHPERPEIANEDSEYQNEIDNFIAVKLNEKGLNFQNEAEEPKLLRRLYLDLTGLPPTPKDIEKYISNSDENKYEAEVDKLLNSPHYGEHWASMWLDLARYADSKGYEADRHREIWKFRDWVIDAFNDNIPFDEFTVMQLAGDMLPDSSRKNMIATAFHRNTMNNDEGGTDNEEFRTAAVLDRVNTTWDVWMGVTFACVQCHDHPYDPISQKEYYEFMAFLNNTADADMPSEYPTIKVYKKEDEKVADNLIDLLKEFPAGNPNNSMIKDSIESLDASTLPVMVELEGDKRRSTHIFESGNWLVKGMEVESGVPENLSKEGLESGVSRLEMAKWIVSEDNPLTARVTVNRFWGHLFGKGIVETQEDFGSQGAKPTHPELLDWLAVEFRDNMNWDVKALLKRIVTTKAYRQSSVITDQLLEKDPYNDLISRSPRKRVKAEQMRDQALAVSGLLSNKMYGPSVMPPQPEGIWNAVYNSMKWETSDGEDKYRRALYTYWRRTSPYPSFISFDSPSREFCVNRRIDTNTPLQALIGLNDPVYIEAAKALALNMEKNGKNLEEKIIWGYRRALMESPDEETLSILMKLHAEVSKESSIKLISHTESEENKLTPLDMVANAILNLDAFLNY